MPFKNNLTIDLKNTGYVPVIKDSSISYGGSQMWFPEKNWYSTDYILYNYGCGTIATADMFLYLALQNNMMQSPETELALKEDARIEYKNYDSYIRRIHHRYTKTKRVIAVLGPKVASSINSYSNDYGLGLEAAWKWSLNYYDMYDLMEEMLREDIPVILSIGPNTPNFWGKKGIPFYERKEIDYVENDDEASEGSKPYYYKIVRQNICGHYITVTGIVKDEVTNQIMLHISSWGKQYYINYEEYRDYVDHTGGGFSSSLVQVKRS